MPHYILSGTSSHGETDTKLVEAESSSLALERFREQGYGNVVLHTDEAVAATIDPGIFNKGYTPKIWVDSLLEKKTIWANFRLLTKVWIAKEGWLSLLIAPFTFLGISHLFTTTLHAIFGFDNTKLWDRILDAASWGRGEEMLKLIPLLRKKTEPNSTTHRELIFQEANALAFLGRIEEALAVVKTVKEKVPDWMYFGRLSLIYFRAGHVRQCLASEEKAVELAPENGILIRDLASLLALLRQEIPRARALFERSMQLPIGESEWPMIKMIDGMITLEEGNHQRAVKVLAEAVGKLNQLAEVNGLFKFLRDRTRAYWALALNATNQHDKAIEQFRLAERRLTELRTLHDLRDRCLKELCCQTECN